MPEMKAGKPNVVHPSKEIQTSPRQELPVHPRDMPTFHFLLFSRRRRVTRRAMCGKDLSYRLTNILPASPDVG
jgi:hypothetical protein